MGYVLSGSIVALIFFVLFSLVSQRNSLRPRRNTIFQNVNSFLTTHSFASFDWSGDGTPCIHCQLQYNLSLPQLGYYGMFLRLKCVFYEGVSYDFEL